MHGMINAAACAITKRATEAKDLAFPNGTIGHAYRAIMHLSCNTYALAQQTNARLMFTHNLERCACSGSCIAPYVGKGAEISCNRCGGGKSIATCSHSHPLSSPIDLVLPHGLALSLYPLHHTCSGYTS